MSDPSVKKGLAVIVAVTIIAAAALIILYSWPENKYPGIPSLDPYINDDADLLYYEDWLEADNICYQLELENSCQIALYTTMDIGDYDLNTFALMTFEKNGIGQKEKDNGVLIIFFIDGNQTRWRTVTGDGISSILNGAVLKDIENTYLIPNIEINDLSWGILVYIDQIALKLEAEYISEGHDPNPDYPISFIPLTGWDWVIVIIAILVLGVVTKGRIFWLILALFGGGGRGGFGGGRTGGGGSRGRL